MRLDTASSIVVLVDVQERLFPHMPEAEELGRRLSILLQGAAILGLPVLVTQQYTKGLGSTIEPLLRVLGARGGAPAPLEKIAFGCCDEPAFVSRIEEAGRKRVILAGIEAHVCVLQTVTGLLELGYDPVVVVDCVSSRRAGDRDVALRRMEKEGATLTTSESALFELTRLAGTDTFRAISRLVK
jgi:nicotinamidase-related amidase